MCLVQPIGDPDGRLSMLEVGEACSEDPQSTASIVLITRVFTGGGH